MCQSINQYENNNIEWVQENDVEENNDLIMSSKYQYIDEDHDEGFDIFDLVILSLSRETFEILFELIEHLNEIYEFNDDIDECNHDHIDDYVSDYSFKFCEKLLYEYGIRKGIKEYTDEFGELDLENENWIKEVVNWIIKNNIICRIEEVNDENRDVEKIKSYLRVTKKL